MSIKRGNKLIGTKFDKTNTWGGSVTPTVSLNGIIGITPPSETDTTISNSDEFGRGGVATCSTRLGLPASTSTVTARVNYETAHLLLYGVFGDYSYTNITTGVEQHTLTMQKDLTDLASEMVTAFSLAEGDETLTWNGLQNSVNLNIDNGLLLSESEFMCDKVTVSVTGTPPTLMGCSSPIRWTEAVAYIDDVDAAADFTDNEKVTLTNLSLSFNRGLESGERQNGEDYPSLPMETVESRPSLGVTMVFKMKGSTNTLFRSHYTAKDRFKARFVFTGATISGVNKYKLTINIPCMGFTNETEAPTYGVDSPTPVTVNFNMMEALEAPEGMTGTMPYAIIINTQPEANLN